MHILHRSRSLAVLLILLLALTGHVGDTAAQFNISQLDTSQADTSRIDSNQLASSQADTSQADETAPYVVRMHGPSLWEVHQAHEKAANPAGVDRQQELAALQTAYEARLAETAPTLEAHGALIVDELVAVAYGFVVRADQATAARIAADPRVKSVRRAPMLVAAPLETNPRPDRNEAVPQIGARTVAADLGYDGRDVLVAVLSAGIDYTHADFGGPGTAEAYANNNENRVESGSFPTRKVVGGYDLAGERYSPHASCIEPNPPSQRCTKAPQPDDDPLDSRGEGTHSAGVIAGQGFGGVGPGVAPRARLVALKVFGNPIDAPVVTDLMHSAFDWVFKNNLRQELPGWPTDEIQVIDMGLASGWLGGSYETRELVRLANEAGISVVVAAGNQGNTPYYLEALPSSDEALTVGAVWPTGQNGLEYEAAWDGEAVRGMALDSGIPGQPKTRDQPMDADVAYMGTACNGVTVEQDPSGKIALIQRGDCGFVEKFRNAVSAGAVGAVVFTLADLPMAEFGGDEAVAIPAAMIDYETGVTLRDALLAGQSVRLRVYLPDGYDVLGGTVAAFSSRGPSRFDPGLKPQVMAPGLLVTSSWAGAGESGNEASGTFISSAVTSGTAALLWQRNLEEDLDLAASDISALLMNHAVPEVRFDHSQIGTLAPVMRQGAGMLDAVSAARAHTLARSDRGLAELDFGDVHVTNEVVEVVRTLTVRNFGDAAATYSVATRFLFPEEDSEQGVTVSVSPSSLELAAGASTDVQVTLRVDPVAVRPWVLYGQEAVLAPDVVKRLEIDGYVEIVETDAGAPMADGDTLTVPFAVTPQAHSCVAAVDEASEFHLSRAGDRLAQRFENPCPEPGWADAYALVAEDEVEEAIPEAMDIVAVGYRRYLSNEDDPESDIIMEWIIQTRGPRPTPESAQFRILIDINQDGEFDSVIYNLDAVEIGRYVEESFDFGRWLNAQGPLVPDTLEPDHFGIRAWTYQPYELFETTTVLIASADEMGIDLRSGSASFDFAVAAVDVAGDYPVTGEFTGRDLVPNGADSGEKLTYNQLVDDCMAFPLRVPVPGGESVTIDAELWCEDPVMGESMGLFFAFPTNAPGLGAGAARQGRYVEFVPPAYLPYAAQEHVRGTH